MGVLKTSVAPFGMLFAMCSRHLAVLTDSSVGSTRPSGCGLAGRAPSARLRAGFLSTPPFSSYGPGHSYVYE